MEAAPSKRSQAQHKRQMGKRSAPRLSSRKATPESWRTSSRRASWAPMARSMGGERAALGRDSTYVCIKKKKMVRPSVPADSMVAVSCEGPLCYGVLTSQCRIHFGCHGSWPSGPARPPWPPWHKTRPTRTPPPVSPPLTRGRCTPRGWRPAQSFCNEPRPRNLCKMKSDIETFGKRLSNLGSPAAKSSESGFGFCFCSFSKLGVANLGLVNTNSA